MPFFVSIRGTIRVSVKTALEVPFFVGIRENIRVFAIAEDEILEIVALQSIRVYVIWVRLVLLIVKRNHINIRVFVKKGTGVAITVNIIIIHNYLNTNFSSII